MFTSRITDLRDDVSEAPRRWASRWPRVMPSVQQSSATARSLDDGNHDIDTGRLMTLLYII